MDNISLILPAFLLGGFLEAAILLRHKVSWKRFFALIVLIAAGSGILQIMDFARQTAISNIVLFYFIFFVISYAVIYPQHILPKISRRTLAGLTVIFWYFYLTSGLTVLSQSGLVLFGAIILSVMVFVVTLFAWPIHEFWRLLCYLWFLLMVVYFSIYHLVPSYIFSVLHPGVESSKFLVAGNLIVLGMTLFYLAVNILMLLQALPLRFLDKSKSTAYALWEWKQGLATFYSKYRNDSPLVFADTLIVAAVFLAVLLLNHKFVLIPKQVLADILILWTGYFFDQTQAE